MTAADHLVAPLPADPAVSQVKMHAVGIVRVNPAELADVLRSIVLILTMLIRMAETVESRATAPDVSKTGTNGPRVRKLNEALVLDLVRRNGTSARPWIAEQLELEFQTVSNICNRLIAAGYLQDGGPVEGLKRQSRGVVVNPLAAFALGVEINRSGANIVLVGLDGAIIDSNRVVVAGRAAEEVLGDIEHICAELQEANVIESERLVGLGISVPGPIDSRAGVILEPANFDAWHGVPIGPELGRRLELPTWVNTTATSAALGAQWAAAGSAHDDFVYVYLGGGVGLGVIANGRPLRGAQGNAGEFAHLVADPDGPICVCGQRGCLVQFATPQAFLAALQESWVEERRRDPARAIPMPSTFEVALQPDAPDWMVASIDNALGVIGRAITRVVVTLDPSAVIFGGPTSELIGERLIERTREVWRAVPTFGRGAPEFMSAEHADLAGALGAASLPLHSYFSPRPIQ